jgi:hypothetical protein
MARETRAATAAGARAAAAAVPGTPGDVGAWGPLVPWDVVGVHSALTTDGTVLTYDSINDRPTEASEVHTTTRAMLFDPATGAQSRRDVQGFNLFCSGLAHLPDGAVFLAGGNKNRYFEGIRETHTFRNGLWALGRSMVTERWYPTVTAMPNGEMLITAGQPRIQRDVSSSPGVPDTPEVRTTSGDIRQLSGATRNAGVKREEYPWTQVAPNGEAVIVGPEPTMRSIDTTGTGRLRDRGVRDGLDRGYGAHAMYDVGKILVTGGARPATSSSVTVDVNGPAPAVAPTSPMGFERRQHNLTVLADGSVLATGGLRGYEEQVDLRPEAAIYAAERWDPATGQWKTLAAARQPRQYHSTALLLPDGRVLTAGGGLCGRCADPAVNYLAKDAQIFSPPYLFREDGSPAPRPQIEWAPDAAAYGAPLEVITPQAGSIAKVALVRLGAVTHSVDMGQRYVPLQFSAAGGTITAAGPANANIAPPGPYMLVVVDNAGVPSVAKMITVSASGAPSVALTRPAGETLTAPATLTMAASATDPDGIRKVEFFNGPTRLGEDTSAPYELSVPGAAAGSYTITARATDNAGVTSRSGPAGVTVVAPPAAAAPRGPTASEQAAARARAAARVFRISVPSRVTLRRSATRMSLRLRCLKACRGTLRVETRRGALRGKATFRLRRAGTRTLRVRLGSGLRRAARRAPQRLRVTVSVRDGRTVHVVRRNFTLRVR